MEIFIDADACPVKAETFKVAERHRITVHVVSNRWMQLPNRPIIQQVVVPGEPDAADDWIAERITDQDICITADIPLAARCIAHGAGCLNPNGKPFTEAGIGGVLAMRNLMTDLRDTGMIQSGGPAFSQRDRSNFLNKLEQAIQAIKRKAGNA